MSLVACSGCRSLVLSRDVACPFCGAAMRTIVGSGAIKTAVGTLAGAAVLASGIGCAYGAPCSNNNCMPKDGGLDITIGDVDSGKKDASTDAISDAPQEADSAMDAAADATDAKSD